MRCATYAVMALERVASTIVSTADTVIPSFPETYPRPAGVQTTSDGQIGRGGGKGPGGGFLGSRGGKRGRQRRPPVAGWGDTRVAGAGQTQIGGHISSRSHPRVHGAQPEESGRRCDRPHAVSRLARHLGAGSTLAAGDAETEG